MKAHPKAGLARINLTFRRLDPQTAARAPACKCGQKAVLKVCLPWARAACSANAGPLVQALHRLPCQAGPDWWPLLIRLVTQTAVRRDVL